MKLENQVCSLEQARRLFELGIHLNSRFAWCWNGAYKNKKGEPGFFINLDGFNKEWAEAYCAYTVAELMQALRGYAPFWVAIWSEWGYREGGGSAGTPRGYGVLSHACAEALVYLLENNYITAEEVNERLLNA